MADHAPITSITRAAERLSRHYGVPVDLHRGKHRVGRRLFRYALLAELHIRRNWERVAKRPRTEMPAALYGR